MMGLLLEQPSRYYCCAWGDGHSILRPLSQAGGREMHARTVANPVDVAGGSEVRSDNGLNWVL